MHRWTSGSPSAGGSAFGSPNAPTPTGYYGHYASHHHHGGGGGGLYGPIQPLQPLQPLPPTLNRAKSREAPKATGPVYPILALPEKRKVVVKKKVVDEQGQEVEVEQEEEEDVYTKPKRLFYFDR
ncbi:hypothetical protein FRB90_003002 [Tulasnella sp. 427]|nr:hypothetical protein FRB90_003002 [Tulasnella sp. 427]